MSGYGLGCFIFDYMSTFVVNPDDKRPLSYSVAYQDYFFEFELAKEVPLMLYCLIASWCITLGLAIILVQKKKQKELVVVEQNVDLEVASSPHTFLRI
jgi:hypothetical protein